LSYHFFPIPSSLSSMLKHLPQLHSSVPLCLSCLYLLSLVFFPHLFTILHIVTHPPIS
jgi:hypothetical protein